ncbi:MAG TPA: diguanylate cyclase [Methylibium sp.]|uniref:diguanylate cyclase n=1 Tax=Methylibium sp. TaxID=2067992 RepID=UPI002DB70B4C|nr:diguanylate cyclase [Methylibium sp.]HEU4459640.1 diguanylate cyclase [Methylibium sp.]
MLGLAAATAQARPDAYPLAAELRHAREHIGIDPPEARRMLAALRDEAARIGSLAARLEADEIECRLLTDIDAVAAVGLADAGVAAADAKATTRDAGPVLLNRLRLEACAASAMADTGRRAESDAALAALVERTAGDPDLAAARALALLERGVARSRSGALAEGQQDLLAACELSRQLDLPRDHELCMGHLANHYKRVGDLDDALRYLQQLIDAARARGASFDQAIYAFSLAQVHVKRGEWDAARRSFDEALSLKAFRQDPANVAYAEGGIGDVLLRSGRPREAEQHLLRSLEALGELSDVKQRLRTTIALATARARLDAAPAALRSLGAIEAPLRALADPVLLAQWFDAEAESRAAAGDWPAAYRALAAFRTIDADVQRQRLSDQSARLRMQFNREKDALDLASLRTLNERGQQLRRTQAIAIALFVLLLAASLAYAVHKVREARRLRTLALSDELTGLPNRRAVLAAAQTLHRDALRGGHAGFNVLVVDVDHFKRINDSHGHAVGDEVLRHLAQLLPASLRASDRLGRIGGEEFLAVLPEVSAEQALAVAERMRRSIERSPAATSAGDLPLSVSIGLASMREGNSSLAELIRLADLALYQAKAQGRNQVVGT